MRFYSDIYRLHFIQLFPMNTKLLCILLLLFFFFCVTDITDPKWHPINAGKKKTGKKNFRRENIWWKILLKNYLLICSFYLRDLIRNKDSSCDFISKSSILKSINQLNKTTTTTTTSSGFPKRKLFSLKLFIFLIVWISCFFFSLISLFFVFSLVRHKHLYESGRDGIQNNPNVTRNT